MYDENEVKKWLTANSFESGNRDGSIEKAVLDGRNDVLEWLCKFRPNTTFTDRAIVDLTLKNNIEGLKLLNSNEIMSKLSFDSMKEIVKSGHLRCVEWLKERKYLSTSVVSIISPETEEPPPQLKSINEEIVKTVPVFDTTVSATARLNKNSKSNGSRVWSRTDVVDEAVKRSYQRKNEERSLYYGFSSSIEEKLYNPDRYPLLSMCFEVKSNSDAINLNYDMYTLLTSKIRQFEHEGIYTHEDIIYMEECLISALLRNICYVNS